MVRAPRPRWHAARPRHTDMKGPVAAAIVTARELPATVPITLLITTDEETTKQGARADRADLQTGAPDTAARHRGGRTHRHGTGARPSQPHRLHLRRNRRAGAQQHRPRPQRQLGPDPVPGGDESDIPTPAHRHNAARRRLHAAIQRLQPGDRQPRRRSERHRPQGHRAHQIPLLGSGRSNRRIAGGVRRSQTPRDRRDRGSRRLPPELPADHPLVRLCADLAGQPPTTAPYGTDASELQAIAPCVVLGPATSPKRTRQPRRCASPISPPRCRSS